MLYHEGAVYTCPVPELVKFTDTNGDGAADEKEVMVSFDKAGALDEIREQVTDEFAFPVKQHAIRMLPKVNGVEPMTKLVGGMTDGLLAPELQLDVLEVSKDPVFAEVKAITEPIAAVETA